VIGVQVGFEGAPLFPFGVMSLGPRARVEAVLPDALVKPGLVVLPVIAVTVALFYWLWRVKRGTRRPPVARTAALTN
jgi:hypothetical protein